MVMIEEYPTINPNRDRIGDVQSTLNMNLARKVTQLAVVSLCSIAGLNQ